MLIKWHILLILILSYGTFSEQRHLIGHKYYVISAGELVKKNVKEGTISKLTSIKEKKRSAWKVWKQFTYIPSDNDPQETTLTSGDSNKYENNMSKVINPRNVTQENQLIVDGEEDIYDNLRLEYFQEIYKRENETFKIIEETPETIGDIIGNNLNEIDNPTNCSQENGYGIQAAECLLKIYKEEENVPNKIKWTMATKVLMIWVFILVVILTAIWCIKGWCCCCCPFNFCKPDTIILRVKRYIAVNPPGIWDDSDLKYNLQYAPSDDEVILYDNMSKKIMTY